MSTVNDMLHVLLTVGRLLAQAHHHCLMQLAPRRTLQAEIATLHERLECARAENKMLRTRLERVPARHRPRFRVFERLEILWHAARYQLSVVKTARAFVVSEGAILKWRRDVATGELRLVRPTGPANRLPDFVGETARRMKLEWPRLGTRRIAGMLGRLGLQVARSTVQSLLRRRARPGKASRATKTLYRKVRAHHVTAKRPGHVWFIDFTRVGGLFRSVVVGAVIDGCSRKVLALRVASQEPTAQFAVRLVREAARDFGAPTYLVSDHGKQLTAGVFRRAMRSLGILQRFGALHRSGSIARMERFWKSLKDEYARGLFLWRPQSAIERLLRGYATWFNTERPHQGIGQRTPDEAHFGTSTRARVVPLRPVLAAASFGDEAQLPVVRWARAA